MTTTTVHLAVYDTLADWEIGYLTAALAGPPARDPETIRLVTVGPTTAPIRTIGGLTVVPDMAIADLSPADSSILVLPGANLWFDGLTDFAAAARTFVDAGVPVAAICGAVLGIARAGLLDSRPHTGADPGFIASSGYAGAAFYRPQPSVSDGLVVTASPVGPVEFARDVLDLLDVCDPTKLDAWFRLYRHQDASAYYDLVDA